MNKLPRLPDSEVEIMNIIWSYNKPITSTYIMKELEGHKTWGLTTVLNLLTRLVKRDFLIVKKQGRFNVYSHIVQKDDYLKVHSSDILTKFYDNSVKNFVSALYDNGSLSKESIKELKNLVEQLTSEDEDA